MKFLVLWTLAVERPTAEMFNVVARQPDYARRLAADGKLAARYHLVGKHGGAWIYDVDSNEELERLLAMAPVYNFSRYDIYPLAEMEGAEYILQPPQTRS